jgi:hypothetical protein
MRGAPRTAVLLAVVGAVLPAAAGGPRKVNASGDAIVWDTDTPVLYFVDRGELGTLSNDAADALLREMFDVWEAVAEARIQFMRAGQLEVDVTGDNYRTDAYPPVGSGISPVVFDDDGSILHDELGDGAEDDILGITSYDLFTEQNLFEVSVILNGRCHDGEGTPGSPCELSYDELRATVLHELGHFAGLDHTDLNREFFKDCPVPGNGACRPANNAVLPTMYPIKSEDDATLVSLHLDDRLALGRMYPGPGFPPAGSALQGRVLACDNFDPGMGICTPVPFDGANVIARSLEDPYVAGLQRSAPVDLTPVPALLFTRSSTNQERRCSMRAIACVLALALGAAVAAPVVRAQECTGVLPVPPETTCTYEHLPFQTFTYVNGTLRATWSADYQILEMYIVADWEIVGPYVPGAEVRLPLDPSGGRYDFLGKFRRLSTGETINGLTVIWCRGSGIPGPVEGCFASLVLGCNTRVETTCEDGTKRTCNCQGDEGTCGDCSQAGKKACCTSSTTETTTDPAGRTTTTTSMTRCEHSC